MYFVVTLPSGDFRQQLLFQGHELQNHPDNYFGLFTALK